MDNHQTHAPEMDQQVVELINIIKSNQLEKKLTSTIRKIRKKEMPLASQNLDYMNWMNSLFYWNPFESYKIKKARKIEKISHATQYKKKPSIKNFRNEEIEITTRETDVLKLICMECSNSEIAKQLNLSVRTVEGHRNNLLIKIGCRNTAGLVLFAVKQKMIAFI